MNIVDSSGRLEYFSDGSNSTFFATPLQESTELIVPTITIYEVFNVVCRQRNESDALQAITLMQQGRVVDLASIISIVAAKISIGHRLPVADSIILATARTYGATIWTQDSDFKNIKGVQYIEKNNG
ncbi:MAG: type II toxin-antitoxin system VapC family toxin [Syntrophorhabdus aromaticivorans]|uniref:Type II toxin-antitoxin system VapC family toxin n=1 Tax=Syntrophorhabdus aromaticivorans TaxID=328301 RepID=A0A971M655_9BACT|nr:type II toxin-antitoxin system VapC family toxin [Syntrophorhabdus aromaticivorans]